MARRNCILLLALTIGVAMAGWRFAFIEGDQAAGKNQAADEFVHKHASANSPASDRESSDRESSNRQTLVPFDLGKHSSPADLVARPELSSSNAFARQFESPSNGLKPRGNDPLVEARRLLDAGELNAARYRLEQLATVEANTGLYAEVQLLLGSIDSLQGREESAIARLARAIELRPQSVEARNNLAMVLATARNTRLRDPARAVTLARSITAADAAPQYFDTLAIALHAAGRLEEANSTADTAYRRAVGAKQVGLARRIAKRISQWERHANASLDPFDPPEFPASDAIAGSPPSRGETPTDEATLERLRLALATQLAGPTHAEILAQVAWIMATHPDSAARDGQAALLAAQAALGRSNRGQFTPHLALAAALAEVQQFARAREAALAARRIAGGIEGSADETQRALADAMLMQFGERRPYRDSTLPEGLLAGAETRRLATIVAHAMFVASRQLEARLGPAVVRRLVQASLEFDARFPPAAVDIGTQALENGDYRKAYQSLAIARHSAADDPRVLEPLAQAASHVGKYRVARQLFEQLESLRPQELRYRVQHAWLLATCPSGQWRDARRALSLLSAIEQVPSYDAQLHQARAASLAGLNKFASAVRESHEAFRLAQLAGDAKLAEAVRAQRMLYEARRSYRQNMKLPDLAKLDDSAAHLVLAQNTASVDEAIGHYEASLRLPQTHRLTEHNLGLALLHAGRSLEAIAVFARSARLHPESPASLAELAYLLAESAPESLESPADILELAQFAAWMSPKNWLCLESLSIAQAASGQIALAAETAHRAIAQAAANEKAIPAGTLDKLKDWYMRLTADRFHWHRTPARGAPTLLIHAARELGLLAIVQGRPKAAERYFTTALKLDSSHSETLEGLALSLQLQGKTAAAIEHYRLASIEQPDSKEIQNNLAWALATSPTATNAEIAEATALANAVVATERSPNTLGTLSAALAATGDFSRAMIVGEEGITLAKDRGEFDTAARLTKRMASLRANQPIRDSAASTLSFHSAFRDIHVKLGDAAFERGEFRQAIRHWTGAAECGVDSPAFNVRFAWALRGLGQHGEARSLLESAQLRLGTSATITNAWSWLTATARDVGSQELADAVQKMEEVCERATPADPAYLDTLAVAYAATGQFHRAVAVERRVLSLADPNARSEKFIERVRNRLALFSAGKAYYE